MWFRTSRDQNITGPLFIITLNNAMKQSPFRIANNHSASQETLRLLLKLETSLPCSQEYATGLYPEPDESSPHPHIVFL